MPNITSYKTREELNKYYREYRKKHARHLRKYKREYNKKWRKKNGYHNEKKSEKKYPRKERARKLLHREIKENKIIKLPCLVCGKKRVQGHHTNYNKPLEVIWLCALHHKQIHNKNK